jgi:UDPglucose 6-dehydrogenase
MKIGITGMGFVGKALANDYGNRAELVTYDIADGSAYPETEMRSVDLEFICVGTPSNPDGSCDLRQVEAAVAQSTAPSVVLKSTVPVGTTEGLMARFGTRLVFSPEFAGEGAMSSPFWNDRDGVPFTIVGGEQSDTAGVVELLSTLEDAPHNFFQCTTREAELIKYMENCYLAAKVVIFNEFHDLAVALGADWERTRQGLLLDSRIGESHSIVTAERGFGGRCFPKDTAALLHQADSVGVDLEVLRAAVQSNARLRAFTD